MFKDGAFESPDVETAWLAIEEPLLAYGWYADENAYEMRRVHRRQTTPTWTLV